MDKKPIDKKRRKFLKILAIGGGALVLGRLFEGSLLELFYGPPKSQNFKEFNVEEKNGTFTVSSKDGQEVFVMDNNN